MVTLDPALEDRIAAGIDAALYQAGLHQLVLAVSGVGGQVLDADVLEDAVTALHLLHRPLKGHGRLL